MENGDLNYKKHAIINGNKKNKQESFYSSETRTYRDQAKY